MHQPGRGERVSYRSTSVTRRALLCKALGTHSEVKTTQFNVGENMPDNKKMILNLFAGMQDALFLGDRFAKGEFVSFLQPGQFISSSITENANSDDMAIQSDIANILIDSTYVNKYKDITYSGSTELLGSVNQVYEDIIQHQALPYKQLSPEVLAEIEDLKNWLAAHTPNYEVYRDRYYDALEAYDAEAFKQHPDPVKLQRLDRKRTDALRQWQTLGEQRLYDLKYGRHIYLTQEDPSVLWARLALRLQNQQQQAPHMGPYYQTFLVPPVASWGAAGWATFERTISEQDSYEYSKSTAWSGGISGAWGLWSWGGGASGSTNYQHQQSSVSTVSLKFDYLRVRIFRPWLVEDVFGYRFWQWRRPFCDGPISDGGNLGINPPVRPIGRMPVLPRYLIVVRNVEITGTFSSAEQSFYSSQIQSSASVGWGPFSVSGSYRESTQSRYVHASFDGVTFRIQQPQVIARTGLLLPRSPNPNQSLTWQGDQCSRYTFDPSLIHLRDYANSLDEELRLEASIEANNVSDLWFSQRMRAIDAKVEKAYEDQQKQITSESENKDE